MELHIRPFDEKDLLPLYELLSDEEVMRYIEPPFSPEQTKNFLKKAGLSDPPLIWVAENENGVFIGYVIYHDYDGDSKEIGWILKREFWGKGCAESLTEQLIRLAETEGKTVVIECVPEQHVTAHIAEKFGFTWAGRREGLDVYTLERPGCR